MKITLVNFLFLVIFALAASSIPVSPAQAPSTRHTSETGEVTYAIGGRHYSHDHIDYQVTLLQLVKSQGITLNNLVETERRAFEGIRLDFMDELGELTTEHYDKNRFEVHQFMVLLIDSLLPGTSLHTNDATVQSIARNALQTCLELEKKNNHTYDDVYPITAGHPLENQGYLGALKGKLEPPHGTKRRASDTPSDGNSGEDNGYLSKTRRLFGHFSGQDKHDGDDVHMSG